MDPSPYRFMLSSSRGVNEPMTSLPAQRGGGWMVMDNLFIKIIPELLFVSITKSQKADWES